MTDRPPLRNAIRDELYFFVVACTLALCAGMVVNKLRDKPVALAYQSKERRVIGSAAKHGLIKSPGLGAADKLRGVVSVESLSEMIVRRHALVVDARPEIFYRAGHIPGALSLPREDFDEAYAKIRFQLEAARPTDIVVYCAHSLCEDADLVREGLAALGYTNVAVLRDGWRGWTKAKMNEETER